jgi:X breakpoint 2-interacting protein
MVSDMARLEGKVERQDVQLAAKERELATFTTKAQKAEIAFKAQLEKLQHERDELQKVVVSTQQVRVQQSHELKKKEKEYIKLQEKLNQVLTEKKKETKPGLEIMNLLQKEGRQRGTWNSKKADGDFYKMIVDAYEAKKQELVAENTDLRALLRSMQSDMRDLFNSPNGLQKTNGMSLNGSFDMEQQPSPRNGNTDVFDLPFHMARDQIEQSLRAKMASIKERMLHIQEAQKGSKPTSPASVQEHEQESHPLETGSVFPKQQSLLGRKVSEDLRYFGAAQQTTEVGLTEADEKLCTESNGSSHGDCSS